MSTNKQRRESERARLQRQLEERREREIARRRFVTIASVIGALVLIAAVVVVIVVATSGGSDKPAANAKKAPKSKPTPTSQTSSPAATQTQPAAPLPTTPCATPGKGSAATTAKYAGLTISGATDLKKAPTVSGKADSADPTTVKCDDLVVGKGKVASTTSQATVEYVGLVYKTGKVFQSSWTSNPATFGLSPQQVIPGFSQGIAGAGKVAPMRVGGRRVIVMPSSTAYGANPPSGSNIPANASLVFIVDLQKLGS